MRPIHLTIEGLRSFRSPVALDFTGRDHIAIVGDTGAGKSSILEAITYALYGQTTFTAQGNQELMNDTSMHLRVVLRFQVSGETWEVARALRRDGQGRVGPASAQLRRVDTDGPAAERLEQVKPVNERIRTLLGLDSNAFLRTVVLPQGRFARLLVEDKPTVRGQILRQVWRTDDLEAAGELAGAARQQAEMLRIRLQQAVSEYPDDPTAHLQSLRDTLDAARRGTEAASRTESAATAAGGELHDARLARGKAVEVLARLQARGVEDAADRLASIDERARALEDALTALDRRLADTDTAKAEIPDDSDGPHAGEAAAAVATLENIETQARHAEAAAEDLRRRTAAATSEHADARRRSETAARADEEAARHRGARKALAEARDSAQDQRGLVERRHAECVAAQRALTEAQQHLAALRGDSAALTTQLDAARSADRRAARTANEARDRLQAQRQARTDAAAAYPDAQQRLRDALAEARDHRTTVERLFEECVASDHDRRDSLHRLEAERRNGAALHARLRTAQSAERESARTRDEAQARLAAVRRADAAAHAGHGLQPGDACPVCARDLPHEWRAPEAAGLREAEQNAEHAQAETTRLGQEVTTLDTQRAGAEQRIDEEDRRAQRAGEVLRDRRLALDAAVGLEPAEATPDRAAVLDPLDAAVQDATETADRHRREHEAHVEDLDRRLSDAEAEHDAAQKKAEAAHHAVVDLDARRQGVEQNAAEAASRIGGAEAALAAAMAALGAAAGTSATEALPDGAAVLAPLDAVYKEAAEALARHDDAQQALDAESQQRSSEAAAARAAAEGADRLADAARTATGAAMARLRAAAATVVHAFRPQIDVPDDPVELRRLDTADVARRIHAARDRGRVLTERAAARERLADEARALHAERTALADRRADEVDRPTATLINDLQEHRFVLVQAAGDLGVPTAAPAAVTPDDAGRLASRIDELRTAAAALARTADERTHEAASRAAEAMAALKTIAARLDGRTPAEGKTADLADSEIDAVVEAARRTADHARSEAQLAGTAADNFTAIIDDVQALRAVLDETTDKERALADLEDALKPGAFLKWLTHRRSRRLLVHASRILGEMSGGKYAFVEPGETDEQWRVLDRDSGQDRSPASLSGGEQFLASLSLALGMVEMMARSGGRLESLFLDEGFGSLDRNNVDVAVQALATVASRGRLVAVISHVRAVAEQIDHVLAVTRGARGSRAEWLTGGQRRRLSEADGLEATSALAGLLE